MKKVAITAAVLVAASVALTVDAQAGCKSAYYTGKDQDPVWWDGRDNAQANWSARVRGALNSRWSRWNKATKQTETCTWSPNYGVNFCKARARPCYY